MNEILICEQVARRSNLIYKSHQVNRKSKFRVICKLLFRTRDRAKGEGERCEIRGRFREARNFSIRFFFSRHLNKTAFLTKVEAGM